MDTSNVTCKVTYAEVIHKSLLDQSYVQVTFKSLSSNFHVTFRNSELTFQLLSSNFVKSKTVNVTLLLSSFFLDSYCMYMSVLPHTTEQVKFTGIFTSTLCSVPQSH